MHDRSHGLHHRDPTLQLCLQALLTMCTRQGIQRQMQHRILNSTLACLRQWHTPLTLNPLTYLWQGREKNLLNIRSGIRPVKYAVYAILSTAVRQT